MEAGQTSKHAVSEPPGQSTEGVIVGTVGLDVGTDVGTVGLGVGRAVVVDSMSSI